MFAGKVSAFFAQGLPPRCETPRRISEYGFSEHLRTKQKRLGSSSAFCSSRSRRSFLFGMRSELGPDRIIGRYALRGSAPMSLARLSFLRSGGLSRVRRPQTPCRLYIVPSLTISRKFFSGSVSSSIFSSGLPSTSNRSAKASVSIVPSGPG